METLTKGLSQEQLELLPTEEDIAFYEEHGWFISKKIVPEEVLDRAFIGAQKFYRGERDATIPYATGYSDWKPGDGDAVRNNQHVSYRKKELRKLLQPIIGAIAAKLARSRGTRLFEDTLVYKAPIKNNQSGGVVGWHSDYSYSSICTSNNMLSAWIPFHDIDEKRAPLVMIDGSHKWKGNEHMRTFNNQNLKDIENSFFEPGKKVVEVPMILEKGQVSFHHCLTIHGSYPNRSDELRMAFALYLQDYDNRYQVYTNQGKQVHHFLDRMCRKLPSGNPDYNDPAIFPTLWCE
ncbi:protein involved in biosynthesis of mitomycin antibiotics/polyketide fumonisin [Rivularia sp. PCC 7116]|uniref:phytanoyl-CoA dioxygenase family protein n=1 Tax=Rivularia sp. PCC 7116 TaxID=373994 RepID=UPI00029F125B|nr:phytanoyl-CoA dioxygenase family protein [Rivularia sp. PCC 7116]AFY52852.1 protein involved in biosynthesis of mitomycin antibiotics/polyketide fumonisin [Rivularia sp. PCC 7116]